MDDTGIGSTLVVDKSEMIHTGNYNIKVSNSVGENSLDVVVEVQGRFILTKKIFILIEIGWILITDVPGPCEYPFVAKNLSADSIELTWCAPLQDGGTTVTNYIVEVRESTRNTWKTVSSAISRTTTIVQVISPFSFL